MTIKFRMIKISFLLVSIALFSCASAKKEKPSLGFPDKNESIFSIDLPKEWFVKEQNRRKLVLSHNQQYSAYILILEQESLPSNASFDDQMKLAYVDGASCQMSRELEWFSLFADSEKTNLLGKGYQCAFNANKKNLETIVYATKKDGRFFVIVFFSSFADWDINKKKYLKYFGSLKIDI